MGESTSNEGSATTHGNALPNRDPPDVTRIKAAAAKRVQAHRWRRRLGLRCVTVRVSDREVRQLISTGYLTLESKETPAAVAIALEAVGFTTISHESEFWPNVWAHNSERLSPAYVR
ncbi:MAG: hypothetical protein ACLQIB_38710 [Isosphaeraceae bacterium]